MGSKKSSVGTGPRAPAAAWLVRAGRRGEDEATVLERGLLILGFGAFPDVSGLQSASAIAEAHRGQAESDASLRARAHQLDKFANAIRIGDLVALPLKTKRGVVALG